MDLLCEVTINGTLHRVSDAWLNLTNPWSAYISSYSPIKFGMPELYGGYAKPKFGLRGFSPDLFASDWPPPKTVTVKDQITESNEAAAVTVFEGTLHLDSYDEEEVRYNAYGASYSTTATDEVYATSLNGVFSAACAGAKLNLTLDHSAARTPSPNVSYTATGEKMLIDNLSDIAAFFSHAFYIEDGTLYLIDLLDDNGTSTLDEFGFFRGSEYEGAQPYSLFKAGDYHQDGSYRYGEELTVSPVCHGTQANIEDALTDIKTICEYDRYRFRLVPEADKLPVIGQKITITNESLQATTTTWIRVTDYLIDPLSQEIVVEGFGVST